MDVILHLTHDCQLTCAYCYAGRKTASSMSWEVAQRAIDFLFAQPTPEEIPQIGFFGGEPLLELPLLKRCIAYAESKRKETKKPFRMVITTNGLGLDEDVAAYLHEKEVEPTLSFDGTPKAQDACRRYPGGRSSFTDTEAAMHTLLRYFPNLGVCAVISPENVQFLPDTIDYFIQNKIRRIHLNPNFFAHWDEQHLDLWRQGYEHAAKRTEEEFRNGRSLLVNFIAAKIITHLKGGYGPCDCCDFGQKEIAIAPSGNIYPCQRMVGEDNQELGLMGNVFDGLNPKTCHDLANARQVTNSECMTCDLKTRCRNWCSCVNHRLTGSFDKTGPLICFHERMAIQIADQVASSLFKEKNKTFMQTFYSKHPLTPEWV